MSDHVGSVLIVDDEPHLRVTATRMLEAAGYEVRSAENADEALAQFKQSEAELVITDMSMPGRSGLELIEELRLLHPDVATIMLTAVDDPSLAERALDLGAYGYIIKPFERNELLIATSNAIRRRELEIANREHLEHLEEMVRERTSGLWTALQTVERREKELRTSREDTIERLSVAAEFRDDETASHIKRMSRYTGLLCGWTGLDRDRSDMVRTASIMHDVGKIGIPDSILLKPGKLTPDEYTFMQQHAEFGYRILWGSKSTLISLAATIALTHHEKWDGSGYPKGLRGEEIPLEGRIAAVADVFDALTTHRVYRKAFGLPDAVKIMKEGRGTHFDADLLDLFITHLDEVLQVKQQEEDVVRAPSA
jgi:putative two-component system response regulator